MFDWELGWWVCLSSVAPQGHCKSSKSNSSISISNSGYRNQVGSKSSESTKLQGSSGKMGESIEVEATNIRQCQAPAATVAEAEQSSVARNEQESQDDTENSR